MKMMLAVVLALLVGAGLVWWRVKPPVTVDPGPTTHVLDTLQTRASLLDTALGRAAARTRDDSVALLKTRRQLTLALQSKDSLRRELRISLQGDTARITLSDSVRTNVPLSIGAALQAQDSVHEAVEAQQARTLAQADTALVSERAQTALLTQRVVVEQDRSQALARENDALQRLLRPPSRLQRLRSALPLIGCAAVGAAVGSLGGASGAVIGTAAGAAACAITYKAPI